MQSLDIVVYLLSFTLMQTFYHSLRAQPNGICPHVRDESGSNMEKLGRLAIGKWLD
jgi:hypothetical protein